MKEKKHIDRIFQEKLKNFERQPNPDVWDGIQAELHNEKKDRKLIPFWWKLGGIAAALMLMLGVSYTIYNSYQSQHNPVVNQKDTILEPQEVLPSNTKTQNNKLVVEDNNSGINTSSDHMKQQNSENSTLITSNVSVENNLNSTIDNVSKNTNAVTETNQTSNKHLTENEVSKKGTPKVTKKIIKDKTTAVAFENVQNTAKEKKDQKISKQENTNLKVANQSDLNSEVEIEENTLKETLPTEKTIEEAIAEVETILNEEEKEARNRWRVSPNVAPVYFNSLGEGSSIHSQFNENNKSSDINMSYGIAASYAINKKLRVRTGVSTLGFDYRTNGIITSDASSRSAINNSGNISNIKFNQNAVATNYMSSRVVALNNAPEILKSADLSSLEQQFGFIEVPLELEYSLIEKKFGLNVVGGFSTFFLNDNNIYEVQNGNSTLIGEANNINDVSYSANFGLGMFYSFSKSLQFNLEPMFKYQINTFSNTFGDFQPFFVGVYTGLSFKF